MDYRFGLRCWQDKAGDENAKANVYVNGTKVVSEQEITKTGSSDPDYIFWESTGLAATNTDGSNTVSIKVELVNDYYVDSSTDRNIWVDGIGYIDKADGSNYIIKKFKGWDGEGKTNDRDPAFDNSQGLTTVTDFTDWENYSSWELPTAVTGDQIPSDFWDREGNTGTFYTIPVHGGDNGVTITYPLKLSAKAYVHDNS